MFEKIPALDADNRAFWTGGQQDELRICHCPSCSRYQHPPLPVCPQCGNTDVEYQPVSGKGAIVSYSVNWQPWAPNQKVPFILAVVELAERRGLWLMTNIVDCDIDQVAIGMQVTVQFIQQDSVWLPVFSPEVRS